MVVVETGVVTDLVLTFRFGPVLTFRSGPVLTIRSDMILMIRSNPVLFVSPDEREWIETGGEASVMDGPLTSRLAKTPRPSQGSPPSNMQEARESYTSIPTNLGADFENVIPQKIYLYPIENFELDPAMELIKVNE